MLQINIKILFFLSFVKGQTYNEIQNNPNNFHMFENFELTKKVYINETKMVKTLQDLKENLVRRQQVIEKFTLNLTRLQSDLKSLGSKEKLIQDLPELTTNFPTLQDWDGNYFFSLVKT